MTNRIAGPGVGLPLPTTLYPANLVPNAPYTPSSNEVALAPGESILIPAGEWNIQHGGYSFVQWLDPTTGIWRNHSSARVSTIQVRSDGVNWRVANLTGCVVAAVVTTIGSGYTQATTTVTANTGGATFQPIIGGSCPATVSTISNAGANYTLPPICYIPPPPSPGVAATAVAGISSGTVSTITITNQGAGYPGTTPPAITILPNPNDPNFTSITAAAATFGATLTNSGGLTAVLVTFNGNGLLTAIPTLTVSGAGTTATATPVWMNTIKSTTITANGAGYGADNLVMTAGGVTAATPVVTNPAIDLSTYVPRQAQMLAAVAGTLSTVTSISATYDSGLFTGTPRAVILGGVVTTVGSITLGLGGVPDLVIMQPF